MTPLCGGVATLPQINKMNGNIKKGTKSLCAISSMIKTQVDKKKSKNKVKNKIFWKKYHVFDYSEISIWNGDKLATAEDSIYVKRIEDQKRMTMFWYLRAYLKDYDEDKKETLQFRCIKAILTKAIELANNEEKSKKMTEKVLEVIPEDILSKLWPLVDPVILPVFQRTYKNLPIIKTIEKSSDTNDKTEYWSKITGCHMFDKITNTVYMKQRTYYPSYHVYMSIIFDVTVKKWVKRYLRRRSNRKKLQNLEGIDDKGSKNILKSLVSFNLCKRFGINYASKPTIITEVIEDWDNLKRPMRSYINASIEICKRNTIQDKKQEQDGVSASGVTPFNKEILKKPTIEKSPKKGKKRKRADPKVEKVQKKKRSGKNKPKKKKRKLE